METTTSPVPSPDSKSEESTPDYLHGLMSFDQLWAMVQETNQQMKETDKKFQETDRKFQETDRMIKEHFETMKETDRKFQETDRKFKETDRMFKETDRKFQEFSLTLKESDKLVKELTKDIKRMSKNLGGLGDSIGGLIETLVGAKLWEKFANYPYGFQRAHRRVQVFDDRTHLELTDIDILLSNTEWVMAVEVKNKVNLKEVERHIKRMDLIRQHPPAEAQGKKLLGAMAGGSINPEARNLANEIGFFLLELKGESVYLVPPPEGFTPKIW